MQREKIGFITGLAAEAALLKNTGFMVAAGGGAPAGAMRAAEALIGQGATRLISFGLAGGLDPALAAGVLVIPEKVIEGDVVFSCDPVLLDWLGGANMPTLLAEPKIANTLEQKSALFAKYGAAAVDLESGAVARMAAQAGIGFAVLRAVADPAHRALPPAALIALGTRGEIQFSKILGAVLRHPKQIPALIKLGQDAAKARKTLLTRLAALS